MKSIIKNFFAGLCLLSISFGATTQVNAQTYEVNDFISYQTAIVSINAGTGGDTIKITGDFTITANPGTIRNDVTITAETNTDGTPKYTITGGGNNTTILCQIKNYSTIENLILTNGRYGIYINLDQCNYNPEIKINNCITSNNDYTGIIVFHQYYPSKKDPKIRISNCKSNNNSRGIYISDNTESKDVIIHNCIVYGNITDGITSLSGNTYIYDCVSNENGLGFTIGSNSVINNCTANNNKVWGFFTNSDCVINKCTANQNGNSGFSVNGANNEINDCYAFGNEDNGYGAYIRTVINNSVAENNINNGFSLNYAVHLKNCLAIGNGANGFSASELNIINNCSAINNGRNGFFVNNLFFGALFSNSTAAYNKSYGINGGNFIINCTLYNNNRGFSRTHETDSLFIYNSIVYNNDNWDLDNFIKGELRNSVYKTENNNSNNLKKTDCTTNDPLLLWLDENGNPTEAPANVKYYSLGGGSSALGLADKSIISAENIIDIIPDLLLMYFIDEVEWFQSIVTEEYITEILSHDQRGNIRSFDGDRYDAGSITGNIGTLSFVNYSPKKAGNYGKCSILFYGNGFDENTEISLKKQGENDIIAENISISNSSKCTATFNLHNKKTGKWDIIINLTDTIFTVKEGFELEVYIEPEIVLEILGSANIRNGSTTSYTVKYSNKGNVNVYCLPVIVEIITDNKVNVEVKERWEYFNTEGVYTDKYATIDGIVHKLDTLHILSGVNNYSTFVTPLIPVIPPYGKGYFTFDVKYEIDGNADNPIEIRSYTLNSLSYFDPESSQTKMADASATLWGCFATGAKLLWDVVKIPLSAIPGVGCGIQIGESILSVATTEGTTGKRLGNAAWETGKVIAECATDFIPGGAALKMATEGFKALSTANDMVEHATGLINCAKGLSSLKGRLVNSCDPNDKIGPISESGSTWISDRKDFTYVINFENDEKATAPAQEVWITDALDLNVFDINSFEAGIMKIGDRIIDDIPFNTQNYTWTIDMRPEIDILLEINLKLDKSSGIATWYFKSIDPATGEVPEDALLGFLPPNDDEGSGQGFVMFSIRLKDGLPDDVTVANIASIVFDFNEPIITPEWVNKRDIVPPTSTMLRPANAIGEVELAWIGSDDDSGVYCYDIYMKREDDDYYVMILSKTKTTSTVFTVEDGVKYSFYSIAYDNAGNRELDKTEPDITIPFDSLPFDTYCVTKWNNTFMLNLKKLSIDGYDIVECEWFKNANSIGDGFSYSAGPEIEDKLEAGAVYYFRLITRDGEELLSTYKILDVLKTGLRAYPNPVSQGHTLTIEGTTKGSFVEVYNYLGICVSSTIADGSVTELTLALPSGIYIVRSNNEVVKVVIK